MRAARAVHARLGAGKALAEEIQASLNEALGANGSARSEDLYILRSGNQPCALVECGYLSNSAEELKLQKGEYQQRLAQAICEGVMAYFGLKA
jgi:N-acetylmuramoyl-L-alanine amidase